MSAVLEAREPSARYLEAVQPALVRQFELLATSPGGVARLRELILALAVQGKLVPQELSDEPIDALLRQMQTIKLAGKRNKTSTPPAEIEIPFEVPQGWRWIRITDVATLENGDRGSNYPSRDKFVESGIAFLNAGHLNERRVDYVDMNYITPQNFALLRSGKVQKGDILYCLRGSLGKFALFEHADPGAIASSLVIIRLLDDRLTPFVMRYLASPLASDLIKRFDNGTAQPNLGAGDLAKFVLPAPPIREQARIVARVDELMLLCDALEAKGRLEAEQHARLLGALLGTLTDSTTPEELAANWQRVAEHFDLLLDRPAAVDALEQTILQLAVRGLLVPQDRTDDQASELLLRVRLARETRGASGGGRLGTSKSAPMTIDEPFALPAGWMWSVLPELCAITGGSTPSKSVESNWIGDIPWVSPKDMKVAEINDAQDHVSPAALAGSLSLIRPGSLLMVVRGMILAHSFPVAATRVPVTINQDMKALTPFEPEVLPFLMLVCAGMKTEILALVDRSTHGTCKLESPKIFGLPVPVPPLAEQARIVARVIELRRYCADLRERLSNCRLIQSHLADSLVEQAAV